MFNLKFMEFENLDITEIEINTIIDTFWSTREQFADSAQYILEMKSKPWTVYWLGNENATDKELIEKKISSKMFYDYCHEKGVYGTHEILNLLYNNEIPPNLVEWYVLSLEMWADEYIIVKNIYYDILSEEAKLILNEYWIEELSKDAKEYLNINDSESSDELQELLDSDI
jgi:hypothetical protein